MTRYPVYARWMMAVCSMSVTSLAPAQRSAVASGEVASDSRRLSEVLARPVTVHLERVSLQRAVAAVAAAAGIHVQYQRELFEGMLEIVTFDAKQMPLGLALEHVLGGTHLRVTPSTYGLITIEPTVDAVTTQRQGSISGKITDARTKQPLRGAKILVDGINRAVSDEGGMYRVPGVEVGTHNVTVKLLGYGKAVRITTVTDGVSASIDVALEPSANTLEQVVVTGTIIPTELKAVPNAMTVITAKQIEERGITKIDQLFRGDVPGVFAQNIGPDLNGMLEEVTMFSRGVTSFGSSAGVSANVPTTNPIKTYVDGIEMADPKYLSQIDPKSIERIEILTGPQASTIYGSNAINGVMQIFTKRGTSNTPQIALNLLSGWVENDFSNAHTPQHDYSAQLNGMEGRLSYNAGTSWNYIGPWTPAKQTARTGGFGGVRLELLTEAGRITTDVTLRRTVTQNRRRGALDEPGTVSIETGWYNATTGTGVSSPATAILTGQTLGFTLGYVPVSWWSHEFGFGQDGEDTETRYTSRGYRDISDTTFNLGQSHTGRRSLRYTTTSRIPVIAGVQATATAGTDAWQSLTSSLSVLTASLTGTLADWCVVTYGVNCTSLSRQPGHNTGAFGQIQLGIGDHLFFTYGLRAEWNPNYGADAEPKYNPRYGIAYTQDIGDLTMKWRASYGRSTRPPLPSSKAARTGDAFGAKTLAIYGHFLYVLANPELGPEYQQGGEGGLELYLGNRGSLVMTRFNQTVDGLINSAQVDSVRSLMPDPFQNGGTCPSSGQPGPYCYIQQFQYLNIGSIRNQGWEWQGSVNTGPFITRGTYSWTKSRTIGVTEKYRAQYQFVQNAQYRPGATYQYLPEHTWAFGTSYVHAKTIVGLNVTGVGQVRNSGNEFSVRNLDSRIRLLAGRMNVSNSGGYVSFNPGYAMIDFTASQRVSSVIEGVVQVQNLANHYANDYAAYSAVIGRQSKIGMRVRVQ